MVESWPPAMLAKVLRQIVDFVNQTMNSTAHGGKFVKEPTAFG